MVKCKRLLEEVRLLRETKGVKISLKAVLGHLKPEKPYRSHLVVRNNQFVALLLGHGQELSVKEFRTAGSQITVVRLMSGHRFYVAVSIYR